MTEEQVQKLIDVNTSMCTAIKNQNEAIWTLSGTLKLVVEELIKLQEKI